MSIDKNWHLAGTEEELKWTEFELQLWRIYYAFERWQLECEKVATGLKLSVDELAILHVIRMNDRSKTIAEIGRLLNRIDPFNINYIIKNLIKKGLVVKDDESSSKQLLYMVTEEGKIDTDTYTEARSTILFKEFLKQVKNINLEVVIEELMKIKNVYDEAYRVASSSKPIKKNPLKSANKNSKKK